MVKKVAFIGCSHFAAFEKGAGQGINSWTWQLAQKYPVNLYRNYSVGGRGIEYFQWCLMHAKSWGANVVFVNRTYTGRWAILGEFDENANKDFVNDWLIENHAPNWDEVYMNVSHCWGSGGSAHVNGQIDNHLVKPVNAALATFTENWATTELRRSYENYWYSVAPSLYNFDNLFVIDWAPREPEDIISNVRTDTTVASLLINKFNAKHELDLWKYGVTIAADDNHLTHKGHKIMLEEYLLPCENVIKALTR